MNVCVRVCISLLKEFFISHWFSQPLEGSLDSTSERRRVGAGLALPSAGSCSQSRHQPGPPAGTHALRLLICITNIKTDRGCREEVMMSPREWGLGRNRGTPTHQMTGLQGVLASCTTCAWLPVCGICDRAEQSYGTSSGVCGSCWCFPNCL